MAEALRTCRDSLDSEQVWVMVGTRIMECIDLGLKVFVSRMIEAGSLRDNGAINIVGLTQLM